MPKRKPRQPLPMGRKQKRSAVKPNPKNVKFVDRQIVPYYKGATGRNFASAYNEEIFQFELDPQSADFGYVAPVTDTQSKNTKVMLGVLYNRNSTPIMTQSFPRGKDLTPCFYTDKYRISFNDIVPDHADSAQGFLLRAHIVQVKIAPGKVPIDTSSWTNWSAGIEALANREIAQSNMTSDFLEFSKANRNLRIISTQDIRPNRNQMIRKVINTGGSGEIYSCPPPVCFTVKHQIPTWKQRFIATNLHPMLENMYVNVVVFTCDQLTLNTGTFKVEHSSKFYFKDS